MRVVLLWSPWSSKQQGFTDRAVSSHTLLAELELHWWFPLQQGDMYHRPLLMLPCRNLFPEGVAKTNMLPSPLWQYERAAAHTLMVAWDSLFSNKHCRKERTDWTEHARGSMLLFFIQQLQPVAGHGGSHCSCPDGLHDLHKTHPPPKVDCPELPGRTIVGSGCWIHPSKIHLLHTDTGPIRVLATRC